MNWFLNTPSFLIENDFENLKRHISFFETALEMQQDKECKVHEQHLKDGFDDCEGFCFSQDTWDTFPTFQRNALFMLSYAKFEQQLNELCTKYFEKLNPNFKLDDFSAKDGIINKAKLYLSKVHNINRFSSFDDWKTIEEARKNRNKAVHSGAQSISKEYLEKVVDTFEVFLSQLAGDYDLKLEELYKKGEIIIDKDGVFLSLKTKAV